MKTVHSRQVSWAPVGTKKKTSYPFRHVHVLQIVREIDSELFQGFVKTGNLEDDNTVVQAGFYRSFRTIRHQRFYGSDWYFTIIRQENIRNTTFNINKTKNFRLNGGIVLPESLGLGHNISFSILWLGSCFCSCWWQEHYCFSIVYLRILRRTRWCYVWTLLY